MRETMGVEGLSRWRLRGRSVAPRVTPGACPPKSKCYTMTAVRARAVRRRGALGAARPCGPLAPLRSPTPVEVLLWQRPLPRGESRLTPLPERARWRRRAMAHVLRVDRVGLTRHGPSELEPAEPVLPQPETTEPSMAPMLATTVDESTPRSASARSSRPQPSRAPRDRALIQRESRSVGSRRIPS